jgi:hypothetical protein
MSLTPTTDNSHIPLAYAIGRPGRPGILTAVGILSIVLGALSILASSLGIVTGLRYLRMSKMRASMLASMARVSAPASPSMPAKVPSLPFIIPVAPSILTITEAALSLCLAVFLIIAGIWMLRDSPAAGRLHRIYVALKIPLIALAAIATWWTTSAVMSSVRTMTTIYPATAVMPTFGNMIAVIQAAVGAVFALLYPIALLIVLSTRTAKEHFNTL